MLVFQAISFQVTFLIICPFPRFAAEIESVPSSYLLEFI